MADEEMGAKKSRLKGFEGVLVHGSKKFKIELPSLDSSLKELSDLAYELTQVPSSRQRLIYKGRSLTHLEKSLQDNDIKNGAKIMLIGKKNDPIEEKLIQSIDQVSKEVEITDEKFKESEREFVSLQQGFLSKEQTFEALNDVEKCLKRDDEKLMKCIENLDCMDIDTAYQEAKAKRRNLIKKIQKLHDEIDAFESKLKEYRTEDCP